MSEINKKIAEFKKRILLIEGQKIAKTAEWQKQNRINCDTIASLKKEIKELVGKYTELKSPLERPVIIRDSANPQQAKNRCPSASTTIIHVGKASYPIGAKTPDQAIFLTDLKLTENRKQIDLLQHRLRCKKERYTELAREYQDLLACKERVERNQLIDGKPPETVEEETNHRLVCQLENEIHRMKVQWMEAEHVRKKYRSIQASLLTDAERFERSLKELEESLQEQQIEINRLTEVHNEAVEMRDAAKIILHRQEQQTHFSQKLRERQALDYRRQVEMRKMELERIGSKLFLEGKTSADLPNQNSIESDSEDKSKEISDEPLKDSTLQLHNEMSEMDKIFKSLMEVTGATTPQNVLERFSSQKESAIRLNYLQKTAEAQKSQHEDQREQLAKDLEVSKFADVIENEIDQEVIDKTKANIANLEEERQKNLQTTSKTATLLNHLQERLHEIIFKLQEIDESKIVLEHKNRFIQTENLPEFLMHEASDEDLIEILKYKLRRSEELRREQNKHQINPLHLEKLRNEHEENILSSKLNESLKMYNFREKEKPPLMPSVYLNLFAGRGQRATGTLSSSPDQAAAPGVASDEDGGEIPTRNYLKRQSALVVESKARRKPLRANLASLKR